MSLELLWAVVLLPLAGAAINGMVGQKRGRPFTNLFGVGSVWLAFALAALIALTQHLAQTPNSYPDTQTSFYWFDAGVLKLRLGLLWDPLSTVMTLIVTGVGALIHTYSMGYMEKDPGYNRYFSYLNLFTFSMLLLVLADSFLLMFVGWELVGLCSYLLIGFWYDRRSATNAGKKAFIVNRVGDWAFIIGVILTFVVFVPRAQGNQALRFQPVFHYLATNVRDAGHLTGTLGLIPIIALLFFIGATGKSAQLPLLHVWLPDAMEGPTPVSALIHAATMVTAGVYMVARCHDFFLLSPDVMRVVAWIGAFTAFFAATTAMVQTDIKRVLAYSTISQIGFMFIGAGVGAFTYSIFHLMTHAFFKALLFLGAGAVIHSLHDEQDMRKMGGLHRHIRPISILMLIGVATISGIFPLSGFWSKDLILGNAAISSPALWAFGTLSSFLTAFYMTRLWLMTFWGEEHWKDAGGHGSEPTGDHAPVGDGAADGTPAWTSAGGSGTGHGALHATPQTMLLPMAVLAFLSIVGGAGALFLPHFLGGVFSDMRPAAEGKAFVSEPVLMAVAFAVALAGMGLAWMAYGRTNLEPKPWMRKHPDLFRFLTKAWLIDELLHLFLARGGQHAAQAAYDNIEVRGIDQGAVHGLGGGVFGASRELRVVQSGIVGDYALAMTFGVACVVVYFLLR